MESTDFGAKGEQNMTKGPNGEKRPADAIGRAVMVARIATGEDQDTGYVSKNRRNSGVAGAEARMGNVDADRRSEIAILAATARWKGQEATMNIQPSACDAVAALYERKIEAGLTDVKFFVDDAYKATREAVCKEVLRLEEAIENGEYEEMVFNDRHC
jgi:hypothetical protein